MQSKSYAGSWCRTSIPVEVDNSRLLRAICSSDVVDLTLLLIEKTSIGSRAARVDQSEVRGVGCKHVIRDGESRWDPKSIRSQATSLL